MVCSSTILAATLYHNLTGNPIMTGQTEVHQDDHSPMAKIFEPPHTGSNRCDQDETEALAANNAKLFFVNT
jgi:hypothetical protein